MLAEPDLGIQTIKASLSVPVLHHPFSGLAFSFDVKNSFGATRNRVMVFSRPRGCVSIIQLSVDTKVGIILACSNESSPLQFTIIGLSSSTPHVIFAPLRALRKQGVVVRPVLPMYDCAPKISVALRRTCRENDLCLGLLSRRSY